jgi:multiple sugar transport system permease protein
MTSIAVPAARSESPPHERRSGPVALYLVLVALAALTMLPFAWVLSGSLRTTDDIQADPGAWLPAEVTLNNFARLFSQAGFGTYLANSIVVAAMVVVGNVVGAAAAGYALAKLDFAGKRLLFGLVMVTLMVPGVVTFVPLFVVVSALGLTSTYAALTLPLLAGPLGVFLMRQFIMGIPDELLEAARIDGAGELRIFARIVMPLCGPPLATLAILTFLGSWNNFLWPLVVAQTADMYTLPVALSLYSTGQNATRYGILLAGSVLVIAPMLLLFVLLQRYFVRGIALTGIK